MFQQVNLARKVILKPGEGPSRGRGLLCDCKTDCETDGSSAALLVTAARWPCAVLGPGGSLTPVMQCTPAATVSIDAGLQCQ